MRALLDVNVLLALLDRDHVDHERARAWITGQIERGWASCAITQNGFVRVISQPRYPSPISVAHAIDLLARATHTRYHEFWSCTVSIRDSKVCTTGLKSRRTSLRSSGPSLSAPISL